MCTCVQICTYLRICRQLSLHMYICPNRHICKTMYISRANQHICTYMHKCPNMYICAVLYVPRSRLVYDYIWSKSEFFGPRPEINNLIKRSITKMNGFGGGGQIEQQMLPNQQKPAKAMQMYVHMYISGPNQQICTKAHIYIYIYICVLVSKYVHIYESVDN